MIIVHIAGNLGADPDVRFTSSGQKVTTLRVATRVRKGGKDETVWWRVSVWGEQYDKMISYLKKGSSVMVVGEMDKPEIFVDREGKSQISMSITAKHVMFSPFGGKSEKGETSAVKSEAVAPAAVASSQKTNTSTEEFAAFDFGTSASGTTSVADDEIPF
ncbi:MAG: single-stranded DNA-binding protein [Chlamydiota bacterium]